MLRGERLMVSKNAGDIYMVRVVYIVGCHFIRTRISLSNVIVFSAYAVHIFCSFGIHCSMKEKVMK